MLLTRLAALAAISFALMTFKAEASTLTCYSGDRVISCGPTSDKIASRHHRASKPSKHAVRALKQAPIASEGLGSGVVQSHKTGAKARVSPAYRAAFQAYIDDIEATGAVIRFMGGIRPGPCWSGGMHPCGKALDVCQLDRGVVDRRCNLPGKTVLAAIAKRHGLFEGGLWCHSDYGHAQVGMSASPCGHNLYAAVGEFQARSKRHRKVRYAFKH